MDLLGKLIDYRASCREAREGCQARGGSAPGVSGSGQGKLSTKLKSLEPLNRFPLIGDDLSLPYQSNRHETHGDDAKR
jgi:hypothetical protein